MFTDSVPYTFVFLAYMPYGEERADKYPSISPYAYCGNNPVMLVDPDGREPKNLFYSTVGTSAMRAVSGMGASNKFKGLYIVAQRRVENGFNMLPPANNPMNIKGQGDLGKTSLMTTEYFNGVKTNLSQNFAKFSSVQKGFEAYINLLQKNYPDAHCSLTDNTKTILDFANGLQNGRLGQYATDPNYIKKLTSIFNSVVNDYKQILSADLQHNNGLIEQYQSQIDVLKGMGNNEINPIINLNMQKIEAIKNKNMEIEKDIKLLNDLK